MTVNGGWVAAGFVIFHLVCEFAHYIHEWLDVKRNHKAEKELIKILKHLHEEHFHKGEPQVEDRTGMERCGDSSKDYY